jgi:serine/threonine protein kinase
MSLAPGVRLGAYEVSALIGAGGMGEVYRARDTRLGRNVAIKVLPDAFVHDADRLARFRREAQVLASLNHPHIAAIYGLEQEGAVSALVLELVDGPSLADRIARGPMPLEDVLPVARQIAEALEAAHEHGIIHRDLKPANIKLTSDGKVKVLDFGLAKAIGGAAEAAPYGSPPYGSPPYGAPGLTQSPTITTPAMTLGGVILGTAPYMSPEQARGKPLDKRTDIWAFGCVLYEMLTGRRAFDGEDVADVLAKILQREPDYTLVDRTAPPSVRRLLRRCLEKDRKRRLADMADARFELDEPPTASPLVASRGRWGIAAAVGLAALVGASSAFLVAGRSSSSPPAESIRFQLTLPTSMNFVGSVAVSPDGRHLAFAARTPDAPFTLRLRPLNAVSARVLSGTEGAVGPFWSPDSRFVAFIAPGSLKKIDISSGDVTTITTGSFGAFPSWGVNDTLLFAREGALHRVSSTGGTEAVVVGRDGPANYAFPSFLPDGDGFLFADIQTLVPQRGAATIYVGSLGSGEKKELLRSDSPAVYANGHVLFVRDRTLVAQPFDLRSRTLTGEAVPLAENLWPGSQGTPYFSASQNGVLAFPVRDTPPAQLAWVDRTGKRIATLGEPGDLSNPRVSPDGKKVAVCVYDRQTRSRDIWVLDLERGTRLRLTSDPADDMNPTWSADSATIVFSSDRKGQRDLYRRALHEGEDRLLYTAAGTKSITDWSPDGRQIMFHGAVSDSVGISFFDVRAANMSPPVQWQHPRSNPSNGQFSPDGRWVAFTSSESGRNEVYVAPVSGPGGKVTVSTAGGIQPRWSRDGKEIFYLTSRRDRLVAVPVQTQGAFQAGSVRELFQLEVADALGMLYDVSPDGRRFLVNVRVGEPVAPITVVVNWLADLKK